jgi:hypothetical protein
MAEWALLLNEVRIKENGILIQLEGLAFFTFLVLATENVVEITTALNDFRTLLI